MNLSLWSSGMGTIPCRCFQQLLRSQRNSFQTIQFLNKLTNYSDCEWNLLAIDEYYKLNKSGYSSDEDFERKLSDIFAQGV